MIAQSMSTIWATVAQPLANHLWQSTLCAAIAAALAWVLRKNQARIRYRLWLVASLKFLIPFSLLISLGGHLAPPKILPKTPSVLYSTFEQVGQPFTQAAITAPAPAPPSKAYRDLVTLLPAFALAIWFSGFLTVLLVWFLRWRRISGIVHDAVPMREGEELETLRRLECTLGIEKSIPLLLSSSSLEPGIFGIVSPKLIWPQAISERFGNTHLEAILAHEISHVRRRDNLMAALHMVVEAIFWFHPLVWWLGARLVEEREHSCDEQVLELGHQPQIYAEGILKTCEFCLESSLACMSGVAGADLKKRIVRIMTGSAQLNLDLRRKLLLGFVGIAAVTVPLAFGLLRTSQNAEERQYTSTTNLPDIKFAVASIKLHKPESGYRSFVSIRNPATDGRLYVTNASLKGVLLDAYGVQDFQVAGGPGWIDTDRYDIEAKADNSVDTELKKLSINDAKAVKQRMIQALLADRFQLTLHHETKELPVYVLVAAKNGPKLEPSKQDDNLVGPDGKRLQGGTLRMMAGGPITFQHASLKMLAQFLSRQLGRVVLDETGLNETYDFTLQLTPSESPALFPKESDAPVVDISGPSLFTAIQEQLGLKLKPQKGPVEILTIDHVERPSEN